MLINIKIDLEDRLNNLNIPIDHITIVSINRPVDSFIVTVGLSKNNSSSEDILRLDLGKKIFIDKPQNLSISTNTLDKVINKVFQLVCPTVSSETMSKINALIRAEVG